MEFNEGILVPSDDSITLSLVEQRLVTHQTVRISVNVQAKRDQETDEKTLRRDIRNALNQFIKADWRIPSFSRAQGTGRFEDLQIHAVARVPENENVQLQERANKVSNAQIQIVGAQAAYSLPFKETQQINRELRTALVKQAREECEAHNQASGRKYRVARILFADTPTAASLGGAQNMRAGNAYAANSAYATAAAHTGSTTGEQATETDTEAEGAGDGLNVTHRFWAAAEVTLCTKPE